MEETIDLPRLAALVAYWREYPPTHVCSKVIAGIKTPTVDRGLTRTPDFVSLPDVEE